MLNECRIAVTNTNCSSGILFNLFYDIYYNNISIIINYMLYVLYNFNDE